MFSNFKPFIVYIVSWCIYVVPGFFDGFSGLEQLMLLTTLVYAAGAVLCGYFTNWRRGLVGLIFYIFMLVIGPVLNTFAGSLGAPAGATTILSQIGAYCNLFFAGYNVFDTAPFYVRYIYSLVVPLVFLGLGAFLASKNAKRRAKNG